MASTRRKSAAIALAVVGVAGLSLASAAQLTLNSESLGAGSTVVESCDSDGIAVGFTNDLQGQEYVATSVDLSGVADTCSGLAYELTVLAADDTVLAEVDGTSLTVTDNAASIAISESAAAIARVALVIHG